MEHFTFKAKNYIIYFNYKSMNHGKIRAISSINSEKMAPLYL